MTNPADHALADRIAKLEASLAALKAESAVYRGALVWLMGVHQLGHDDQNPRRAVLEPMGLSLDYTRTGASGPAPGDPQKAAVARDFIEAAYSVFLSRQPPAS
jgi:hypothetical protein